MDESDIPRIEAPPSLLPNLEELGIEEIDRGICLDTFENRRTLREHKHRWSYLYDADGKVTDRLQVVSPEMIEARGMSKAPILKDPEDPDSDYLTGVALLVEPDAAMLAPTWVLAATKWWNKVELRREETGKNWRPALTSAPGRCIAYKSDGSRCWNWHNGTSSDGEMCRLHLGRHGVETNAPERARNRIKAASLVAVEALEELIEKSTSEPVRLKAATEILDRAGIRGGVEIDAHVTQVQDTSKIIAEKLAKLAPKAIEFEASEPDAGDTEEVTVAEVVEDDHR